MARLTDTQLLILSAASQRDDRGVELPANIRGEAGRKVVDKLIRAGLLEEVRAGGSLPVWRRDAERGPMALRITKNGLEAIDVGDEAPAAPKATSIRVCTENLDPDVMVMQSAEERIGANAADPLNWARDRRIFVQRSVRSRLIIVRGVFAQDPAQVRLAQEDNMVDALATDRSGQSFGEAVLPR